MTERAAKPPAIGRSLLEAFSVPRVLAAPLRRAVRVDPFADGAPALVIPGMMSGDGSTSLLRRSLSAAGYDVHGWGVPLNTGIRPDFLEIAEQRLAEISVSQPATLIGWSLGGFYARALGQRHPDMVSQVITLGTPFSGDRHANRVWRFYDTINDHTVESPPVHDDPAVKPGAYTIAMWSPKDGVVSPECSCGNEHESDERVELPFAHLEMATSRRAVGQIIEFLAKRHSSNSISN